MASDGVSFLHRELPQQPSLLALADIAHHQEVHVGVAQHMLTTLEASNRGPDGGAFSRVREAVTVVRGLLEVMPTVMRQEVLSTTAANDITQFILTVDLPPAPVVVQPGTFNPTVLALFQDSASDARRIGFTD